MAKLADNAYNTAICNPPYSLEMSNGKSTDTTARALSPRATIKSKRSDNERPSAEYFAELRRVSRNQIIKGCRFFLSAFRRAVSRVKGQASISLSDFLGGGIHVHTTTAR